MNVIHPNHSLQIISYSNIQTSSWMDISWCLYMFITVVSTHKGVDPRISLLKSWATSPAGDFTQTLRGEVRWRWRWFFSKKSEETSGESTIASPMGMNQWLKQWLISGWWSWVYAFQKLLNLPEAGFMLSRSFLIFHWGLRMIHRLILSYFKCCLNDQRINQLVD